MESRRLGWTKAMWKAASTLAKGISDLHAAALWPVAILAALAMSLPALAPAATITPTSYSYTGGTPAGETGYSGYQDTGLTKLTDGNVGTTNPVDGTWVGWQYTDSGAANITFTFASSMTITNVALDFLRNDNANVQLPTSVTVGGTTFPTADFGTDVTQGFVNYSGSWTGSQLVVTLNHPTSNWVFVNEAQFTGDPANGSAPEPASLLLSACGIAVLGWVRRRHAR